MKQYMGSVPILGLGEEGERPHCHFTVWHAP